MLYMLYYSHINAAAFVSWAPGCCAGEATLIEGCVIAAKAAKFCIFIGGNKPAAATAVASG